MSRDRMTHSQCTMPKLRHKVHYFYLLTSIVHGGLKWKVYQLSNEDFLPKLEVFDLQIMIIVKSVDRIKWVIYYSCFIRPARSSPLICWPGTSAATTTAANSRGCPATCPEPESSGSSSATSTSPGSLPRPGHVKRLDPPTDPSAAATAASCHGSNCSTTASAGVLADEIAINSFTFPSFLIFTNLCNIGLRARNRGQTTLLAR